MLINNFEFNFNRIWNEIEFEELNIESLAINQFASEFERLFVNGGVIIKCFGYSANELFENLLNRRASQLEETTFFMRLFEHKDIKRSIVEFNIQDKLVYIPKFNQLKIRQSINYRLGRGTFFEIMRNGGAYVSNSKSEEEIRGICLGFTSEVVNNPENEYRVFECFGMWNDWFFDVAWDYSYLIFNLTERKVWMVFLTDTD